MLIRWERGNLLVSRRIAFSEGSGMSFLTQWGKGTTCDPARCYGVLALWVPSAPLDSRDHLDVFCTWTFISNPFGEGYPLSFLEFFEAHLLEG